MNTREYKKVICVEQAEMDKLYSWLDTIPPHKKIDVLNAIAHEYSFSTVGRELDYHEKLDVLKVIGELSSVC